MITLLFAGLAVTACSGDGNGGNGGMCLTSCDQAGPQACGVIDDGCGGTLQCGACPTLVDISLGHSFSTVLLTGGGVKTIGGNSYGELGNGEIGKMSFAPVDVTGLTSGVKALSSGYGIRHACVISDFGSVNCWGDNSFGQLGDGTMAGRPLTGGVIGLRSGVRDITCGREHVCALTDDNVKCWGSGKFGQLGDGMPAKTQPMPVIVKGLIAADVLQLTSGESHSCALMKDGTVKCWGLNKDGELGTGDTQTSSVPVDATAVTEPMKAIGAGGFFTCGLTMKGGVQCWGRNENGRLGIGSTSTATFSLQPVDIAELTSGVKTMSIGLRYGCVMMDDLTMKCWGRNAQAQLGDGTHQDRTAPVDVKGLPSDLELIRAGYHHTCAYSRSEGLKCWGYNAKGALGSPTPPAERCPMDLECSHKPLDVAGIGP